MKSLDQAKKVLDLFEFEKFLSSENILTIDSVNRILSAPVYAKISSPNYHAAAMDGIAVDADITIGASNAKPKKLIVGKEAFYVNTGNVMPKGTNAVIMIEHIQEKEGAIIIEAPVFPWQNVRKMGEDIVATELLFPTNHVVTPYCIGALLSGGIYRLKIKKKPNVLILPTGNELIDWQKASLKKLDLGRVIETNSYILGNLIKECGGIYKRYDIIKDDFNFIKNIAAKSVNEDFDIILICGGSSAGSEDYTKKIIEDLGEVLIHGVTIMPGKPVIIGKINKKPVIGIPGYPVSAIIAFEQFVAPMLIKMQKKKEIKRKKVTVTSARKIASKLGIEEFLRVKLGRVGEKITATPLSRGAGFITSITQADGIIRIPANIEGFKENQPIEAELLPGRSLLSLKNSIVAIGSHDNSIDLLSDMLRAKENGIILSSSHVGSMGGITAIKRNAAHIAGAHLLDVKNGSYNIFYIKKFLPDIKLYLINLVLREQGLIIAKNNPKNIKNIEDITRSNVVFINRQSGSGTRILLDFKLKQAKIDPENIKGYENEEFTHMTVAAAVASNAADAGLGIYAAAKALNLNFIPIVTEQYDIIIPQKYFDTSNIYSLLETIKSAEFKKRVKSLGGYHTKLTGNIIFQQ
ncbi:MAG: molybdopterin biosynthesis protein [Deltaproteobacteria bacterium]|nr:molybdopterin biosynthesis protein [Deltaproteobacteria bacterium]